MGLIQSLLQNTTERVSIPDVRRAALVQALWGLHRLRPELPREAGVLTDRASTTLCVGAERVSSRFGFRFRVPAGLDEPVTFLSVHRGDLEPVRSRVLGHNADLDRLYVQVQPVEGSDEVHAAQFEVPHVALSLPAGRQQLVAVFGLASDSGRLLVAERLPLLADPATDQFGDLSAEQVLHDRTRPQGSVMLEALVGLSLFVAFADGHYDRKEEQAILAALLDLDNPAEDLRAAFLAELQQAARGFRYRKEVLDQQCRNARVGLAPEGRLMLVRVLFSVATIDGALHPNEEKLLHDVASQLDVPPAEVQLLIDDFFALNG